VDTILSELEPNALRLSSPVASVRTLESGKILLTTVSGESEEYDHVIMACHADASLGILRAGGGITEEEERILGGFQWNRNVAVVHSDPKVCIRTRASSRLPDLPASSSCLRTQTRGRVGITSRSRLWTTPVCAVLIMMRFLGKFPSANVREPSETDLHVVHVSERALDIHMGCLTLTSRLVESHSAFVRREARPNLPHPQPPFRT
jgi:predicted NAD/FAD-binding protein